MAGKRKKTALETERMTDANIERVIKLLEPKEEGGKPITKKDACQILGMAYNTTRLTQIIDDYRAKKQRVAEKRAQLRGKPPTEGDVQYVISEYLKGESVDKISNNLYRSTQFVKRILDDNAVPIRNNSYDYFKPQLIPEDAVRDRFSIGEIVYSTRYDSKARVDTEQSTEKHGWVYRIWLLAEKWQQFAYQPAEELASLEHIIKLGIKV
jgi:hypothetical protein